MQYIHILVPKAENCAAEVEKFLSVWPNSHTYKQMVRTAQMLYKTDAECVHDIHIKLKWLSTMNMAEQDTLQSWFKVTRWKKTRSYDHNTSLGVVWKSL